MDFICFALPRKVSFRIFFPDKGSVKPGSLRYSLVYHIRDGKFDRVHEYINSPSVWTSFLLQIGIKNLHWQSIKKLSKKANDDLVAGESMEKSS